MANLNRANLITESATLFPDNNTQEISPADLRSWLADGTASFVTQKDKSTLENAIFENQGTTLPSAGVVNLNSATGNYLHISGSVTINSFGTCPAGARFVLMFEGTPTLTYNATSLIIPGLANKTAAAGDCCMIVSEGSGNWRIVGYFAISGGGGGGSGTVTSVDLTMPSAFSVSGNPITTSGTLAVAAAGLATQYIRGDGQLATFPSNAGGGSSVSYYLNGSVTASVLGYKQMDNNAIIGGGTDFTLLGNGLIAQFLTDVGNPNRILIPSGAWNFEMFFNSSANGGNEKFYIELHKYDGATFTLIASSSTNPEPITGGTSIDLYLTSLAVPTTVLLTTDRLAVRVYIVDNAVGRTITLNTEDNTLCEIITTFAGGISALNGLTENTQYFATGTSGTDFAISSVTNTHTFNIPDASNIARGLITTGNQTLKGIKTFGNGASAGEIRLLEGTASGSNYVSLKSPVTLGADLSLTFPNTTPGSGQSLVSDGSGVLSWSSNPGTTNAIYRRTYGGSLTGFTAETLLQSLLVPANTFTDGVGFQLMTTVTRTNAGSNAVTYKLYINTSSAIGGIAMTSAGIAFAANAGSPTAHLARLGFIQIATGGSKNTIFLPTTANTNYATSLGALTNTPIDWGIDQYFVISVSQSVLASTITCNSMQLIPQ